MVLILVSLRRYPLKNKSLISGVSFDQITDVDNPCVVTTYILGEQKGLSPSQFKKVDQDMSQFYTDCSRGFKTGWFREREAWLQAWWPSYRN